MLVYMAAVHTNTYKAQSKRVMLTDWEQQLINAVPNLLESYHYIHKQKYVDMIRAEGDQVFLDSGAFSAYTLGVDLDLPTYCKYIIENEDIIRKDDGILMASVLDGIGDAQLTYENQMEMERLGAKPLPCFHVGEDERYLEWYIANYDYITLGGMVSCSSTQLLIWLERMWEKYLTDGAGRAKIKVHGFGITSKNIMERYPWHSCDSSSWIQAASFGSIVCPQHGNLQVSDKSPSRHVHGQHVSTLTQIEKEALFKLFESQGFTYERLSAEYASRAAYNLWAFGELNKEINAMNITNFQQQQPELF